MLRGFFVLALWLSSTGLFAQSPDGCQSAGAPGGKQLLLAHVDLIDGTGSPIRRDQDIVLQNGLIQNVADARSTETSSYQCVLILQGRTVIPGLIGMHDHLFYEYPGISPAHFVEQPESFPLLYLAGGVTTIRTAGSIEPYADIETKRAIDTGKKPGPRIFLTSPFIDGTDGNFPQMHSFDDPQDVRSFVDYWATQGFTSIKVYRNIHEKELKAAISEAHRQGLSVAGHLCSVGFRTAASLGIDSLEHGIVSPDTDLVSEHRDGVCEDPKAFRSEIAQLSPNDGQIRRLIDILVSHHVAVTSTLPIFDARVPGHPSKSELKRILPLLSVDARRRYMRVRNSELVTDRNAAKLLALEMRFEHMFVEAGGLLIAGSDPSSVGSVLPGFGDQWEVELLVTAGFSPVQAIRIATLNGALFLHQENQIGSIEIGKRADLVVLSGNPILNIHAIRTVQYVFRDGIRYVPQELMKGLDGQVGIQ